MSSKKAQKKEREARRTACLCSLPGLLSQLLLLLNSGMILEAALIRIAEGYGRLPPEAESDFTRQVAALAVMRERTGESMVSLFYGFARHSGVKELSRVAGIMLENRDKGTDLWDKLAGEANMLWQERKALALEKMRLNETKMSFPLGILLMALLLMTAAPAMMQL